MRGMLFAVALGGLLAGSAAAQGQWDREASWKSKPDGSELTRYFPSQALDRQVSGRVTLSCTARADGRVVDCEVVSERPYYMGFGEAAIRAMEAKAVMTPAIKDGKLTDSKIRIPLTIVAPSGNAPYIIYDPIWETAPTFDEVAAAWPAGAEEAEGTAALRCSLRKSGLLDDCIIAARSRDVFGSAARSLAPRFKMRIDQQEGVKFANSDVVISFRFINPASPEGKARKVSGPRWTTVLDASKVLALYPDKAADAGIKSGRGVADCAVAVGGKLVDCKPARAEPADLGFAEAAAAVAGVMQMNPWTDEGRPVDGARIRLPINFTLAEPPPAAEKPKP